MDYITYAERLDYLLEMIEKERLFSPQQIASKFNCCDKTARNMINALRARGNKIEYCKTLAKYLIKVE